MSVVPNSCLTILEDDIISETDQVVESYTRFSKFVKEYGNDPNVSTKLRHKLSEIAERIRSRRKEAFSGDIFNNNEYEAILAHLNANKSSVISHVLVNILYKKEMFQLLKSTCETVMISCISLLNQLDFIHGRNQNQSQLLFAELRKIGCKFLKPTLHEDFLKLTIRLFENITSSKDTLSMHTIVEYLRLKLKNDFPNIQKDDLEMAINLLIRADCLQIKHFYLGHYEIGLNKKCFKYDALRRQHDVFMIAMAQECDIEMNPVKWSQTLYGNDSKTSEMQSIIAQLRSQETFTKLIAKFYKRIERLNLPIILSQPILKVRCDFEKIDEIYCLKKQHPKSFDPVSSDNDPNLMATTQDDIYIMWSDLAESFDLTINILKANVQFFNNMSKLINQHNVYQSNQISKLLY